MYPLTCRLFRSLGQYICSARPNTRKFRHRRRPRNVLQNESRIGRDHAGRVSLIFIPQYPEDHEFTPARYICSRIYLHNPPGGQKFHLSLASREPPHEAHHVHHGPQINQWVCIAMLLVCVGLLAVTAEFVSQLGPSSTLNHSPDTACHQH